MSQLVKFGLILGIICLTATLVLAVTYQVTKPKIDAQLKAEEQSALKRIVPEAGSFKEKTIGDIDYFEAWKGSELAGYCLKVTGTGYNGFMRIVVGIGPDGPIKGVAILEHQETPGLGARVNEIKPGEESPWFLRQFIGKDARTIEVKRNIDAITGATISSRAVTESINKAVTEFLDKVRR